MTFRDYAQGSFRMRGIGKGQTIEIFIIPEVLQLIHQHCGGLAPTPSTYANLNTSNNNTNSSSNVQQTKQMLNNVSAWLVINSMRSEGIQFNMLCEQSVYNVLRKNGFKSLTTQYQEAGKPTFTQFSQKSLDLFREGIDHAVENTIPERVRFITKLQEIIRTNSTFILNERDQNMIKHIIQLASFNDAEDSNAGM